MIELVQDRRQKVMISSAVQVYHSRCGGPGISYVGVLLW